jgi:hypothetical protein
MRQHLIARISPHDAPNSTYASPLRVDLMDAPSRQRLCNYLQARLVCYHEDEHGQPTYDPDQRPSRTATPSVAGSLRRPARGLVTLRTSPESSTQRGTTAVLEISAEGELRLWGGASFDTELLNAALCQLSVQFSDDPAHGDMFRLSAAPSGDAEAPVIWCCVRDRSKWLAIFRRRGVTPSLLAQEV